MAMEKERDWVDTLSDALMSNQQDCDGSNDDGGVELPFELAFGSSGQGLLDQEKRTVWFDDSSTKTEAKAATQVSISMEERESSRHRTQQEVQATGNDNNDGNYSSWSTNSTCFRPPSLSKSVSSTQSFRLDGANKKDGKERAVQGHPATGASTDERALGIETLPPSTTTLTSIRASTSGSEECLRVEDYHGLLCDNHAKNRGTDILRDFRQQFKIAHGHGQSRDTKLKAKQAAPGYLERYKHAVRTEFPQAPLDKILLTRFEGTGTSRTHQKSASYDDRTLLIDAQYNQSFEIKTPKSRKTFKIAKQEEAMAYFLTTKSTETLEQAMGKYRRKLGLLPDACKTNAKVRTFRYIMSVCETTLHAEVSDKKLMSEFQKKLVFDLGALWKEYLDELAVDRVPPEKKRRDEDGEGPDRRSNAKRPRKDSGSDSQGRPPSSPGAGNESSHGSTTSHKRGDSSRSASLTSWSFQPVLNYDAVESTIDIVDDSSRSSSWMNQVPDDTVSLGTSTVGDSDFCGDRFLCSISSAGSALTATGTESIREKGPPGDQDIARRLQGLSIRDLQEKIRPLTEPYGLSLVASKLEGRSMEEANEGKEKSSGPLSLAANECEPSKLKCAELPTEFHLSLDPWAIVVHEENPTKVHSYRTNSPTPIVEAVIDKTEACDKEVLATSWLSCTAEQQLLPFQRGKSVQGVIDQVDQGLKSLLCCHTKEDFIVQRGEKNIFGHSLEYIFQSVEFNGNRANLRDLDDAYLLAFSTNYAQALLRNETEATILDMYLRVCMLYLFRLADKWEDGVVTDADISSLPLLEIVHDIFKLCVPMMRARCLLYKKFGHLETPGGDWVAQRHIESSSFWRQRTKHQFPTIDERLFKFIETNAVKSLYGNAVFAGLLEPRVWPYDGTSA